MFRTRATGSKVARRGVHRLQEEQGGLLVITAVCLSAILACVGIALDVGHLRFVKRELQKAADAAALAAALEVRECGNVSNCSTMQSAAQDALTENGFSSTTLLTQCKGTASSGITLMLNNPVCASTSDPNFHKSNYVEAVVSEQVPTTFGRLVGVNSLLVTAHAEAVRGIGPCIYALDPSGAAITIVAGVILKSKCGMVDESASANALSCVIGIFVYAPSINVTGGSQGLLCGIQTALHTGVPVPPPADPLAYLSAPSNANDSCGTTTSSPYTGSPRAVNVLLGGTLVFNPGVYCGGISITAALASNITFNPGTYILRDATGFLGTTSGGLNLTLSLLSTISGNGVTFYNEGPTGGFNTTEPVSNNSLISLNNVNLSAPTSGVYSGILFFQAHGVSAPGNFLANLVEGSNLQGGVYLPDAPVNYGVSAISSSYNILVAKDINFLVTVASSFGDDYSSLDGGSPLNGNDVSLVQ